MRKQIQSVLEAENVSSALAAEQRIALNSSLADRPPSFSVNNDNDSSDACLKSSEGRLRLAVRPPALCSPSRAGVLLWLILLFFLFVGNPLGIESSCKKTMTY